MSLQINDLLFDELTADPGSPVEGQMWYNSTSFLWKIFRNGLTTSFVDEIEFQAHVTDYLNPHQVDLEQARSQGNTLSGVIDMGNFAINNLGAGSLTTDAAQRGWVMDTITARIAGLSWQNAVINFKNTPPGGPSVGDRYVVTSVATGAWTGKEDQIAEWNGTSWTFTVPVEAFALRDDTANIVMMYDGVAWGNIGGAVSHSSLLDLTADDHLQYLPRSGVRAMTGDLDMGAQNITNVNLVDGVDVPAHASRHQPGGADPIPTAVAGTIAVGDAAAVGTSTSLSRADHTHALPAPAAPADVTKSAASAGAATTVARADHKHDVSTATAVTITDSTNSEGTATSLARSDHTHSHGTRGGGSLHSVTSSVVGNGFMPQSNFAAAVNPTVADDNTLGYLPGSQWINTTTPSEWVCISNGTGAAVWKELTNTAGLLITKAGKVLNASFSGNPKKATVTFSSAFVDTDYAIVLTAITTSNVAYTPVAESQTTGSFVISASSNNISNLTAVSWIATKSGETA